MNIQSTIIGLLNKFSEENTNILWDMSCAYSDAMGTTINQITIFHRDTKNIIGVFTYHVETGNVLCCMYDQLSKLPNEGIIDMLLDMMNYEKSHER